MIDSDSEQWEMSYCENCLGCVLENPLAHCKTPDVHRGDKPVKREKFPAKPRKFSKAQKAVLNVKHGFPNMTFGEALLECADCGFLDGGNIIRIDNKVYAVTVSSHGFGALARELAFLLPGQVRPLSANTGLVWINGRDGPHGVLIAHEAYMEIMVARETTNRFLPNADLPYSIGGCARKLMAHVTDPQPYEKNVERLLKGSPYGYHCCIPGLYVSPEPRYLNGPIPKHLSDEPLPELLNPAFGPPVTMFDVKGYYFQMLRRMETIKYTVYPGSVRRLKMSADELTAWNDVLQCVESNKTLRNSLAGTFAGTLKRGRSFCRCYETGTVKEIHPPGNPGPFRAAGLLLVRSGTELCQQEALQTNCIYATIDSVALTGDTVPVVWPSHGFTVEKRASGNAEICHRGSYQIGPKATENYLNENRAYEAKERGELPSVLYHRSWL